MLKQKVTLVMVSYDDFYKEIETGDDVQLSNLKNDVRKIAEKADIVMFQSQHSAVVMKNRFGGEGQVI